MWLQITESSVSQLKSKTFIISSPKKLTKSHTNRQFRPNFYKILKLNTSTFLPNNEYYSPLEIYTKHFCICVGAINKQSFWQLLSSLLILIKTKWISPTQSKPIYHWRITIMEGNGIVEENNDNNTVNSKTNRAKINKIIFIKLYTILYI